MGVLGGLGVVLQGDLGVRSQDGCEDGGFGKGWGVVSEGPLWDGRRFSAVLVALVGALSGESSGPDGSAVAGDI